MREYKFRGKRLDNGEWVYGDLLTEYIHHKGLTIVEAGCIYHEVDPATVGQFIGEIDIKEQEIFEGDIDGCEPGELMYVAFEEASYGLKLFDDKTYFDNYIDWSMTDIIGNIHDNPELVEAIK